MKHIKLSYNLETTIDDSDCEMLSHWKWYVRRIGKYIYVQNAAGQTIHRIILGLKKNDGLVCDHKDGNGLNNCRSNLRVCTHQENLQNAPKQHNTTSPYKGITKVRNRWRAQLSVSRRKIHLGYYDSAIAAARAYNKGAKKYFGKFAYLNTF